MKKSSKGKPKSRSSFAKNTSIQKNDQHKGKGKFSKNGPKRNQQRSGPQRQSGFIKTKKGNSTFASRQNEPTHKESNQLKKSQQKHKDHLNKIIIQQQLKKQNPNMQKLEAHLAQIKSRGFKQRLKAKINKLNNAS